MAIRPLLHHRLVHSRPGCWVIVDRVLGAGTHQVEAHWHIDPSWHVARTGPRTIRARHGDGTTVWLLSLRDDCELFHGIDGGGTGLVRARSMVRWCQRRPFACAGSRPRLLTSSRSSSKHQRSRHCGTSPATSAPEGTIRFDDCRGGTNGNRASSPGRPDNRRVPRHSPGVRRATGSIGTRSR